MPGKFSIFILLPVFVFCISVLAEEMRPEEVKLEPTQIPEQLTSKGHNRQAVFVNNNSLLFLSKDRRYHKDPQIYFMDLKNKKEKRVTFQRGHIINGLWNSSNKTIFYSSTTDEDTETPFILKPYLDRYPASIDAGFFSPVEFQASEIYSSHINGTNITRVSQSPGFDAFPAYLAGKNLLYFSRLQDGRISIFKKHMKKKKKPSKVMTTLGHDLGLQASPLQNQFVWYRFSPDFKSSQLMISDPFFKNQKFVTLDPGIQWSPSWHPNGGSILYSAKRPHENQYDLYEISTKDHECQRKLTSLPGDEFYPVLSPDGKNLVFTSTVTGQEQVHKMPYPGPLSCTK